MALVVFASIADAGCGGGSSDVPDARSTTERYLDAVQAHDETAIAATSTCRAPGSAFHGATLLRFEALRTVGNGALDSLAASALTEANADSADFARATEENADSLWLRMDEARRRAELYHDARAAAARSAGNRAAGSPLRTCRVHVRIRWGGPLVGPQPVDREHVLRLLAAPGGRWIVYSLLARDRDPSGEPI